ncbi:hypothetical protein CKA32_001358 [Geitlerinema sp. FC II]|nr:hypothetical protein CKA32_001358 [Geitlerinema sp. FC II]
MVFPTKASSTLYLKPSLFQNSLIRCDRTDDRSPVCLILFFVKKPIFQKKYCYFR